MAINDTVISSIFSESYDLSLQIHSIRVFEGHDADNATLQTKVRHRMEENAGQNVLEILICRNGALHAADEGIGMYQDKGGVCVEQGSTDLTWRWRLRRSG